MTRIVAPQGEDLFLGGKSWVIIWAIFNTESASTNDQKITRSFEIKTRSLFWEKQLKNPCHPSSAPGIQGLFVELDCGLGIISILF